MSQSILKRTIGGVDDNRLVLANGEAMRTVSILNNWTQFRIGCLITMEGSATIQGTPQFVFGLSAGKAHGFGDAATTHFLGARSTFTSAPYTAGPPAWFSLQGLAPLKKILGVITSGTAFTTASVMDTNVASALVARQAFLLEVTKGSPNFSLQIVSCNNASGIASDVTPASFLAAMQASTMAGAASVLSTAVGGVGYGASSIPTMAVDEATNGNLDTISIFWDRSGVQLEVSEVRQRKIA